MQRTEVIGIIGKDAEVKDFNNNQVINFSVAVSEKYNDTETTTWYDIAKWGNNVSVAPYLKKGTKVFVSGNPTCRAYINNEGKAVAVQGINAFKIELLSKAPDANQQQGQPQPQQQRQAYNTAGDQFLNMPPNGEEEDDQLPF